MEVVLDRDAFLRGLQMVQNIVEPRQTLPILANVLLETETDTIRLTATDLEVGARVSLPARIAGKGSITVSARKLAEIVKELPAAAVSLKVTENAGVSIRCGGASYKLVGMTPDDFPPVLPASPAHWLKLDAKTLREMLGQTSFAVSHDETRYALNGVLFSLSGKEARLVATDGHRLSWASLKVDGDFARQEVILPRKTVLELGKLLADVDDPVTIDILATQVRFRFGNVELVSKVVDGKFPDYNRVIPTGQTKAIVLSRPELLATLQRAAILSNEKFRGVRVVLAPGTLKIICTNSEQEEADEELEVAYQGEALDIGFNITYLLDVLHNLAADHVQLAFGDANSSALITVPEREDYKYVVMPMRI